MRRTIASSDNPALLGGVKAKNNGGVNGELTNFGGEVAYGS